MREYFAWDKRDNFNESTKSKIASRAWAKNMLQTSSIIQIQITGIVYKFKSLVPVQAISVVAHARNNPIVSKVSSNGSL